MGFIMNTNFLRSLLVPNRSIFCALMAAGMIVGSSLVAFAQDPESDDTDSVFNPLDAVPCPPVRVVAQGISIAKGADTFEFQQVKGRCTVEDKLRIRYDLDIDIAHAGTATKTQSVELPVFVALVDYDSTRPGQQADYEVLVRTTTVVGLRAKPQSTATRRLSFVYGYEKQPRNALILLGFLQKPPK